MNAYLPSFFTRTLRPLVDVRQGVSYRQVKRSLPGYANVDRELKNKSYLSAKSRALDSWSPRFLLLAAMSRALGVVGIPAGTLTPSICTVLRKPYKP